MGRDGTRGDSRLPPNHLQLVQHRPRLTERNTSPTQRTPLPGTPPPTHTAEAPGRLGVLSRHPPGCPKRNHRRTDGPRGPAPLRQEPQGVPQRGASLARPLPVTPAGTGLPARNKHQAKRTKTGQRARQRARPRGGACWPEPRPSHAAPPGCQTLGAHQQHQPHQRPPPPPPPQHPNPAARPRITARTHPRHTRTTIQGEPRDMAPSTPSPRPRPPRPLPSDAQILQYPHQLHHHHTPAQPAPKANHTASHHQVYHRHTHQHYQPLTPYPPAPWYHTHSTHPHHHHQTVQHHLPPPLHVLTTFVPPYAPMDPRGAAHAHQRHQSLQGAPHHHQ